MGQKNACWQVCLPRLCRNFILPVHETNLKFFFQKTNNHSYDFLTLDRKKIQLWSWKTWPGSQYFVFTCPQEHLMETKIWEKFEFFHQCRKLSHRFLAFGRNFFCGVVTTGFYLPIGRFCWKKLLKNLIFLFWTFCIFGHWARTIGLFVKNFSLGLSKLQSSSPKTFCRKLPSLEKKLFCFLLFCQRRRLNKTYWRFLRQTGRVVKTAFYVPTGTFSWEKRNFWTKTVFISFWDMGQKTAFWQVCLPRLCQNFILPVLLKFFSKKHTTLLMTFWQLTEKKFSLCHKRLDRVVKTSFSRVHRHIW